MSNFYRSESMNTVFLAKHISFRQKKADKQRTKELERVWLLFLTHRLVKEVLIMRYGALASMVLI